MSLDLEANEHFVCPSQCGDSETRVRVRAQGITLNLFITWLVRSCQNQTLPKSDAANFSIYLGLRVKKKGRQTCPQPTPFLSIASRASNEIREERKHVGRGILLVHLWTAAIQQHGHCQGRWDLHAFSVANICCKVGLQEELNPAKLSCRQ